MHIVLLYFRSFTVGDPEHGQKKGSLRRLTSYTPSLSDPLSNDLNPDSNFFTCLPTSRYIVKEDINDQVSSFNEKSMFSILHLNARSLLKNLDQLNLLLLNLERSFSVLDVSETWLTDSTSELVHIAGYNCLQSSKIKNRRWSWHLFPERYLIQNS